MDARRTRVSTLEGNVFQINRRDTLKLLAAAPVLPGFLVRSAAAVNAQGVPGHDGPIVVAVRLLGGNDGLNTVVPVHDDRYYRVRPTIGIPRSETLPLAGGDLGLNPWLRDYLSVMDDGHAAIIQGVGYPNSSRSHSRGTEIFQTGSVEEPAPAHGWLGRYLDRDAPEGMAGVQFGPELEKTLSTESGRTKSIGNPNLLLDIDADSFGSRSSESASERLRRLQAVESQLSSVTRQLRQATGGSGVRHAYPDTEFGQSLRWAADMIETGAPTRVFLATLGSFATFTSPSFDTHSRELDMHRILYSDFGRGVGAFVEQMRRTGNLDRVLLLTFSEFGRQVAENRSNGTDHGDAGVMFLAGGGVQPGLLGQPSDLGRVHDGGLEPGVDFRQVYGSILRDWLSVDPAPVLGQDVEPYPVLA